MSNSVLAVFDEDGVYIEDLLIVPEDLANGANGAHWTMATSEFQQANDFAADFTMSPGIPLGGGMVCWGAPAGTLLPPADPASWDHTDPTNYVDCLAYGSYAGPSNPHIGTPTALVPEGHSLVRVSETDDNAADFVCADVAGPTNNAGMSVALQATTPCPSSRASGIQITPGNQRVLINKDVEAQRWTITRNLDDLTVTGNVFLPGGGDPTFLFCEQTDQQGADLLFSCSAADACTDTCPPFEFVADVTLPESFFQPPVDVGAVSSRIEKAVLAAASGSATAGAGAPAGFAERGSGIQITPDDLRVLVNKDVGDERWSITRNLDDFTVTGNVFFPEGGDPLFVFCEQQGQTEEDLQLSCSGADRCSDTACPAFTFISDVVLPKTFFEPPGPAPTPTPGATPTGAPSTSPTPQVTPSGEPTDEPTPGPTSTSGPTTAPTAAPTPAEEPTAAPTSVPTPTEEASPEPTVVPTTVSVPTPYRY